MGGARRRSRPRLVPVLQRLRDSDRGSVVAMAAAAPILLIALMAIVQIAVVGHARHVATMAAEAGLAQVRAHDGTATAGEDRARAQLSQATGWVVSSDVSASRSSSSAVLVVRVEALQIFGFVDTDIEITRAGPVERLGP